MRAPLLYARGYRSRDAAADAIDDMFADGEIDACDNPRVVSYAAKVQGQSARRFGVELDR